MNERFSVNPEFKRRFKDLEDRFKDLEYLTLDHFDAQQAAIQRSKLFKNTVTVCMMLAGIGMVAATCYVAYYGWSHVTSSFYNVVETIRHDLGFEDIYK